MSTTYFIDIDGVLVKHKGNLSTQFKDVESLDHTIEFLNKIDQQNGKIIFTTGRKESMRSITESELSKLGIFYDILVMGCNRGHRVLINDLKPYSNMKTAFAFTPMRNDLNNEIIEKILNPCEERAWGNFSTLAFHESYHVKEIKIKPGAQTSLQSHNHREELWLVISGEGECVIDDNVLALKKGSFCHVPLQSKHRVTNTGDGDLIFIEIQTGDNFSEYDIIRY